MKLYYAPGACSLAPHIVMREAGLEVELVKVDLAKHVTANGADFYAITTKGQVPLLALDDGSTLSEGPIIAQYIADKTGNTTLVPKAGTMERYRVMEWQNFITSELHKSYGVMFNPAIDATAKFVILKQLRGKYEWVNANLAAQGFLTGSGFTAADAYLFTVTNWAKYINLDLVDLKNLQGFMASAAARPAVQAAMKAEGLI